MVQCSLVPSFSLSAGSCCLDLAGNSSKLVTGYLHGVTFQQSVVLIGNIMRNSNLMQWLRVFFFLFFFLVLVIMFMWSAFLTYYLVDCSIRPKKTDLMWRIVPLSITLWPNMGDWTTCRIFAGFGYYCVIFLQVGPGTATLYLQASVNFYLFFA